MSNVSDLEEQALTEITKAAEAIERATQERDRVITYWVTRKAVSAIKAAEASGLSRAWIYKIKEANS